MIKNSFFHPDCNQIIQDCRFQCPKCIEEIYLILGLKPGILNVSLADKKGISMISVEYDPEIISMENIMEIYKNLPSTYEGFFIPELMEI